ncbi:MAG: hypothetical protein Q8L48_31815 [Archangium sp.]|nr:hypothetical protein [Archangium sp.]
MPLMHGVKAFVLMVIALLPATSLACELISHFKVIGFDPKESLVALREETEGTISIHLYELPGGKRKDSWEIITYSETMEAPGGDMDKLGKLRAARWKEAEAALVRAGIKVDPKYPMSATLKLGAAKFTSRAVAPSEYVAVAAEAVRVEGKGITVLDSVSSPTVNDPVGYDGFAVSPSKKTLVILKNGCQAEPAFVSL